MDPPPWEPPVGGVELRVRGVAGLPPALRAAVVVTVTTPGGDRHVSCDAFVNGGRARLEAWGRFALPHGGDIQFQVTPPTRAPRTRRTWARSMRRVVGEGWDGGAERGSQPRGGGDW